jgi:iron complex transport system substrate-binding protein
MHINHLKLTLAFILMVLGCRPAFAAESAQRFKIQEPDAVIDQAGRRILIQKPFERVISLYGAHTENLFALGLDQEIIGVSTHEDFPPAALGKPVFSYRDDPEKFLAARPDLVLIRPMIDRGHPQFVTMLENAGITIVSLQPASVDEIFVYWEIIGRLTGKHKEARGLIAGFKRSVAEFEALTGSRSGARRKRVYFEAIHSKMKTFTPDSMAIFALESAGGINVAADAAPVRNTNIAYYGKERILSRASQIDVYLAQFGSMNRPTVSMITAEPGFQVIKAVQRGQVYIVDERIVSRPTMRLLEGIYRIGQILYPEYFDKQGAAILKRAKEVKIAN